MSATPRTDAAIYEEDTGHNGMVAVVSPDFARTLERELIKQTVSHAQTVGIISTAIRERDEARARIAEVETAHRDLLHTMKVIAGMWIAGTTPLTPADALAERMAKLALAATLRKTP